ncbi:methyltransferase [Methylosinus sp. R-45379]|uniref:class I SAM-dependent methyltransferase n=1 Tax=Methylosinus sp. R-45379 TaxID=980563 RepID=UPI0007C95F6A|nr:class I SAM-dependent methyltransferase [Methylosinus sp. R-45379]OAI30929.1 methyltransferase [Methylosinus sp. R-45379]
MSDGWNESASAWIAAQGERGDFGREHVLDPVMIERISGRRFERALDVGCGEGRFCRVLASKNISVVGIDPTEDLISRARQRDPAGDYRIGRAEALPFDADSFDLIVSYLTLIDIADFRGGLTEMVRVLKPGGTLLIANLNSFISSCSRGWIKDQDGSGPYYAVDRYLEEFPEWAEWSGIRVENWHRPLSSYMKELLSLGLTLTFFDEPQPRSGYDPALHAKYRRAPWFLVMEWQRPKDFP